MDTSLDWIGHEHKPGILKYYALLQAKSKMPGGALVFVSLIFGVTEYSLNSLFYLAMAMLATTTANTPRIMTPG